MDNIEVPPSSPPADPSTGRPSFMVDDVMNNRRSQRPPSHLPLQATTSIEYEPEDTISVEMGAPGLSTAPLLPTPRPPGVSAGAGQQIRYTLGRLLNEMDDMNVDQVHDNPAMLGDLRSQLQRLSAHLDAASEAARTSNQNNVLFGQASRSVTHSHSVQGTPLRQPNTPSSGVRSSSQVAVTPMGGGDWPGPGNGGGPPAQSPNTPGQNRSTAQELRDLARLLQNPTAQAILGWLLRVAPFILIFLLKWFIEHIVRITVILTAIFAFIDCNLRLARFHSTTQTSHSWWRARLMPIRASLFLIVWLAGTYYFLRDDRLASTLIYRSPAVHLDCVSNTLWVAFVADTTAKFAAMIVKCVISLIPIINHRRRGRIFQWLEYVHQLYRYTLTPILWTTYYQHPMHESTVQHPDNSLVPYVVQNTLAWITIILYVGIKIWQCRPLVQKLWRSLRALFMPQPYGSRASRQLLEKAGPQCAVCFGEYDKPLALTCGHVFCEACIGVWLDKERTCPICRTQVVQEDNDWTDATTTCLIQLF